MRVKSTRDERSSPKKATIRTPNNINQPLRLSFFLSLSRALFMSITLSLLFVRGKTPLFFPKIPQNVPVHHSARIRTSFLGSIVAPKVVVTKASSSASSSSSSSFVCFREERKRNQSFCSRCWCDDKIRKIQEQLERNAEAKPRFVGDEKRRRKWSRSSNVRGGG